MAKSMPAQALSPNGIGPGPPSKTQASPCSSRTTRGTRSPKRAGMREVHSVGRLVDVAVGRDQVVDASTPACRLGRRGDGHGLLQ